MIITVAELFAIIDDVSRTLLNQPDDVKIKSCCIDPHGLDRTVPLVHYCIVRADIPFGNQAAQLMHAAGESAALSSHPVIEGTIAVALHAKDSLHLETIGKALVSVNFLIHWIYEADDDERYAGQLMAIGIVPIPLAERGRLKDVIGRLPLMQ